MCMCEKERVRAWCQSDAIDSIAYVDKQAPSLVLSSQRSGRAAIKMSAAGLIAAVQQLACFPVLNCRTAGLKLLFAPSTDSSAFIFQRR